MRKLIISLIMLGIVFIALYSATPYVLETLISFHLHSRGFSDVDLEVTDTGPGRTTIHGLKLRYSGHYYRIDLQARELHLEYSLTRLVKGEVHRISVPDIDLHLQHRIQDGKPGKQNILRVPRISHRLPFRQLVVDHLHIEHTATNKPGRMFDVQGKIDSNRDTTSGSFSLSSDRSDAIHSQFTLANSESYLMIRDLSRDSTLLSVRAKPVQALKGHQQISFELQSDMQAMQGLFVNLGIMAPATAISGSLTANGKLEWPAYLNPAADQPLSDIRLMMNSTWNIKLSTYKNKDLADLFIPLSFVLNDSLLSWRADPLTRMVFYPGTNHETGKQDLDKLLASIGRQAVIISAANGLDGSIQLDPDFLSSPEIRFDDIITIRSGNGESALSLQAKLHGATVVPSQAFRISSTASYKARLAKLDPVYARSASLQGKLHLDVDPDTLKLEFLPGSRQILRGFSYRETTLPSVTSSLTERGSCHIMLADLGWACNGLSMKLDLAEVGFGKNSMLVGSSLLTFEHLNGSANSWDITGKFDLSDITTRAYSHEFRLDRIHSDFTANRGKIRLETALSAADGTVNARLLASHSLKTRAGNASLQLEPVLFSRHQDIIARIIDTKDLAISVDRGRMSANTRLSWHTTPDRKKQPILNQSTILKFQDIGGSYQHTEFTGFNTEVHLHGTREMLTAKPARAILASLDTGLVISDIGFDLEIGPGRTGPYAITASRFRANVLGGQLNSDKIEFDPSREDNSFDIEVSALDIEELLKLYQDKSIYGSGIIDGILPFRLTDQGLKIVNGKLAAREPGGILRYVANETVEGMAKSNPNLKILVDALKDFHYSILDTDLQYSPDGVLKMYLQLEGYNPNLEGGRAVHLNVNLEENIKTLMRSLRLADDIGREIGESIQ